MDPAAVYQATVQRTGDFPPGLVNFSAPPGNLDQIPTPFGAVAFQVSGIPEATQLASLDQLMSIQNQLRAVELEIKKNRCEEVPMKTTEEGENSGLVSSLAAASDDKQQLPSKQIEGPSPEDDPAKPSVDADITTTGHLEGHPPSQPDQQQLPIITREQQAMEGVFNLHDPQAAEEMMKNIMAMQQATFASSFFHQQQQQQQPGSAEFPLPPAAAGALFLQQQQVLEQEFFRQIQQAQFFNNDGGANGTASGTDPAHPATTTTDSATNPNANIGLPLMMMMPPGGYLPPLPPTHAMASNNAVGGYLHQPFFSAAAGLAAAAAAAEEEGGAAAAAQLQQYATQAAGSIAKTTTTLKGSRAASGLCQIPGCCVRLTENDFRTGHPRFQMCKIHKDALDIDIEGKLHRFCQQCGRLQVSLDFDGLKRSCRQSLERHNAKEELSELPRERIN